MSPTEAENVLVEIEKLRGLLATSRTAMNMGFSSVNRQVAALSVTIEKTNKDHENRLRSLEGSRAKMYGATGVLATIMGFLSGWITKLIGGAIK